VVIGDTITVKKAKEAGLQGVILSSGRESVLEAFYRAKQIYQNTLYYKGYYEMYKKVVDQLEQGVAVIDELGKIEEANTAFFELIGGQKMNHHEKSLFS